MKSKAKIFVCLLTLAIVLFAFAACAETKAHYTVKVNGGTGGGEYESGDSVTVTATLEEGETFVCWTVGGEQISTANPYTFKVEKDVELTAVVQPAKTKYTVKVNGGTGGGEYESGDSVTVTASLGENEIFVGWTIDGKQVSADNPYTFEVKENVEITAVKEVRFKVEVIGGEGSGSYRSGEEITVTATLGENEIFDHWTDGKGVQISFENPYTFVVTENVKLTAVTRQRVSAGEFARRWISGNITLDLAAETMTGVEKFELISVENSGAETVMTCRIDGDDYTLSLNAEGALELKAVSAETGSEPEKTFMVAANSFNGAWYLADDDMFTLFIAEPDADGYFGWTVMEADGSFDPDYLYRATTRFTFDKNGSATVEFFVIDTEVTYVINENGNVCMPEANLEYAASDALFKSAYVSEKNKNILIDKTEKTVTVDGTKVSYTAGNSAYGTGIVYTLGEKTYTVVFTLNGVVEYSDGGEENLVEFDQTLYSGEWMGENKISFEKANKILFNGTEYDLRAAIVGGEVVFTFVADGTAYSIYGIPDNDVAFGLSSDGGDTFSFYLSQAAVQAFVGEYNANELSLKIDESLQVVWGKDTAEGKGVYLPALDRTLDTPKGLNGIQLAAISLGDNRYIVWAGEGTLVLLEESDGDFSVTASFYNDAAAIKVKEEIAAGLNSEADFYTSGGVHADTLSFDFTSKNATYNSEKYAFNWDYFINFNTGAEYPVLSFADKTDAAVKYVAYRYFGEDYIRLEKYVAGVRKSYVSLVSDEEYSKLFGTSYVKKGAFADETIAFGEDGKLTITSIDLTASSEPTKSESYEEYALTVEKGVLVVTYRADAGIGFETAIYCDEIGKRVTMVQDEYIAASDVAYETAVGIYYDDDGGAMLEFTSDSRVIYTGFMIEETDDPEEFTSLKIENGVITGVIEYNSIFGSYTNTFVFQNGTVTVTEDESDPVTFTKKITTPAAFVGTYVFDGAEFVISAVTNSINIPYELQVTVDGDEASSVTLGFNAEGKQVLAFEAGFSIWAIKYTAVLDGDKITFSDEDMEYGTAAAGRVWDYSDFAFGTPVTIDDEGVNYTLTCVTKADGKMPLYFLREEGGSEMRLQKYTVTRIDGNLILDVAPTLGMSVRITADAEGEISVGFTPYEE